MRLALLAPAVVFLGGCTTTEVLRIAPPPTLTAPHGVPALGGSDNESLVQLLERMESEVLLCNLHKQFIREFYEEE